jgi:hypothetical protein
MGAEIRANTPLSASFGGNCSRAATVAVIACTIATIITLAGGVFLNGGQLSDIAVHDRGLSNGLASHLGSLRNQPFFSRQSSDCGSGSSTTQKSEAQLDIAPTTTPIVDESLPLLDIQEIWGEVLSRWGDWTMKRYWNQDTLKNALRASDPAQLYPLIKKLENGEPIVVVALGSSIVVDFGGLFHTDLEAIYKLVPNPTHKYYQWDNDPALSAPTLGHHAGWLELFMEYVNQTWPHPDHLLINGGKPGNVPHNFADGSCLENELPRQADLVIIESMGIPDAAGLERLTWRVLRHFKEQEQAVRPAVVYLNTVDVAAWPPKDERQWGADNCGAPGGAPPGFNLTRCCMKYTPGALEAAFTHAGNRHPNDVEHHELARLYGFGSISHRDFLLPYIRAKAWEWLRPGFGECGFITLTNSDSIHPSHYGKVLFADYLWTYLSVGKVAYSRQNNAVQSTNAGNVGTTKQKKKASAGELFDAQLKKATMPLLNTLAGADTELPPLPEKPFYPDGRRVYVTRCYEFQGTKHRISEKELPDTPSGLPIVESRGFEFHENTTHGKVVKRKPGWIATEVGDYMELEIDTYFEEVNEAARSSAVDTENSPPKPLADAEVVLTFLRSYEHMGKVHISCPGGCACIDTEIDAHHEDKTSISNLFVVPVTQAKKCRLKIEIIEGTSSGEHKFKVSQVAARMTLPSEEPKNPSK